MKPGSSQQHLSGQQCKSNTIRNSQSGSRVSILGDIQNPVGHKPWQPALADSASAQVWTQDEVPANLTHSVCKIL